MNDHSSLICHVNLANGFRGGERQTMLLIKSLSERGFKQKLIARNNSELSSRCQSIDDLDVIETNLFSLNIFSKTPDKTLFHFHDSRSFSALYLKSLFQTFNYIYTRRVQRSPKVNFISKRIYYNADKIVALSSSIANSLKNSFERNLEIEIIPSATTGFSIDKNNSSKIRKDIKESFIVGHIGALDDSHKGQNKIIKLAKEAKANNLDIGFILVGSGRDENILKDKCIDLDNIYFMGQVENIGDYLNIFDVFIFPSRHEGLGSSLLDALQFGIPIIASNIGGIPELIEHRVNGYLINGNSKDYFSYLCMLYYDLELRAKISRSNKIKSKYFSIDNMVNSYIKIYHNSFKAMR